MHKKALLASILILSTITLYAHSLKVVVDNLRNSDGVVIFSIYDKDGTIPDEKHKNYTIELKSKITDKKASVVFKNLKDGRYAVGIIHDENENGKIDKGFLLPKEGIGFSNYDSIGLSHKPNFKDASFKLDSDKTVKIKVIYF